MNMIFSNTAKSQFSHWQIKVYLIPVVLKHTGSVEQNYARITKYTKKQFILTIETRLYRIIELL